jgi:peptide/nickel transport system permease protein
MRRLLRTPRGTAGAVLFVVPAVAAAAGPSLVPYGPSVQDLNLPMQAPTLAGAGGGAHLLGTNQLGRDVLSRLLVGLCVSLLVSFVVVPVSVPLGIGPGVLAGYVGGALDLVLMRVVDVRLAVPTLLFMIAVVAVLGSGLVQIVALLAIAGRLTRASYARTSCR